MHVFAGRLEHGRSRLLPDLGILSELSHGLIDCNALLGLPDEQIPTISGEHQTPIRALEQPRQWYGRWHLRIRGSIQRDQIASHRNPERL